MLLVASALKGYGIYSPEGRLGTVQDLLFDDTTWKVRWVVVDTGTWLTSRKVLLHPQALGNADHEGQGFSVALSRHQIEASPSILTDQPVSAQMQSSLYDYYGWDPLWGGSYFGGGAIASPLSAPPYFGMGTRQAAAGLDRPPLEGDPHLRSAAAILSYHIAASDGAIGHLENLMVDDKDWHIQYLIVDTRNWWPGQHVLIAPHAVSRIDWSTRQVELDVSREQVKASPPWDPVVAIDTYYQQRLHNHYGWHGYGW
jgi:sporulation protein YlmC with PRC-barrel domain